MSEVVIYTRRYCGFCAAAIDLLDDKGVAYSEIDASGDPDLRDQMISRSSGQRTFPQIFVGDIHVGGCDELYALENAGKLDSLLAIPANG